ncbi:type V secretion system putative substrate protein, partial [Nicoletella semolina]
MNKIFKVIFNQSTQTWTVVSELAKSATKVKSQITLFVLFTLYSEMAWGVEIFNNKEGSGNADHHIVAWGTSSSAFAGAVALGHQARANIREGIAIGYNSNIAGDHTMAIGSGASTAYDKSLALGYKASAASDGGVALGSESKAARFSLYGRNGAGISNSKITVSAGNRVSQVWAPSGVDYKDIQKTTINTKGAVSVGVSDGEGFAFTRQIINVAAGSADTDAANIAQVRAVAGIQRKYQGDDNRAVSLNLGGMLKIIGGNTQNITGIGTSSYKNIETKRNNNNGIEIYLKKDIKVESIQSKTADIKQQLSVGNNSSVTITKAGIVAPKITFGSGQNSTNAPFFQANGNDIKLGLGNSNTAVKLTNLAEGQINQNSTDAVTGKQLYEVKEEIKQYQANPPGTDFKVDADNEDEQTQKLGKKLSINGSQNITTKVLSSGENNEIIVNLDEELTGLQSIETEDLYVNDELEANNLTVNKTATIKQLTATKGNISNLVANTAEIKEKLTAKTLEVKARANIHLLKSMLGEIETVVSQLVKSDRVEAKNLKATEAKINTATIDNLTTTHTINAQNGVDLGKQGSGTVDGSSTKAVSGSKVYDFVTKQVNNVGFKIQKGGQDVSTVLKDNIVNFADGTLTTVSVDGQDKTTTVKYNVVTHEISSDNQGKAQLQGNRADSKGVAKAVEVVEAVNNASIFLKANEETTQGERIKNGESITVKQGNNIVVERQDSRITVKTVDSPVFKDITADSLTTSQLEAEEAKIVNAEIDDVDVNTLTVNEKANITKLNVSDSANFEGKLTAKTAQVSDNLTVNGKTITNELEVKKGAKIKGGLKSDMVTTDFLNVSRLANLADTVTKDLITRGTAEFKGPATFRKAVQFDRNINVNGSINAQTVNVADLLNAAKAKIVTAEITDLTTKAILTAEKGVLLNTDGSGSGNVAANDHKAVSGDKVYNFVTQQVNNAGFK